MAQQHLNTVLAGTGLDQTEIDAILALADDAAEFKADDYVGKIRSTMETQVKNDPKFWEGLDENNVNETFKKKIESQQYGRANGVTRQKILKAFGYSDADIADMTEEEKTKLELFIPKVAEKWQGTKVSDKELQKDLLEARKKLEELELDIPTREGKIKQDFEAVYKDKTLDLLILAELGTVENLKTPAKYLVKQLAAELKEENAFVVDGLSASPKQKNNPNLDVLEGTKVLSLKDLIVRKLKADNLIEEAKTDNKQKGKVNTADVEPDGTGGLKISSHILEKMKANETV